VFSFNIKKINKKMKKIEPLHNTLYFAKNKENHNSTKREKLRKRERGSLRFRVRHSLFGLRE